MPIKRFVLLVDLLGVVAAAGLIWLWHAGHLVLPPEVQDTTMLGTALLVLSLTVASQLAYVRVPHGDVYEDLAFFEVVAAAGVLLLAPIPLLAALLGGLLVAEVALRRPPLKLAYNLGSFSASTAALIATYRLIDAGADPFGPRSVVAMLLALLVFAAINLCLLAQLLQISAGTGRLEVIRTEWRLSAFMAVGGVGVGMTTVALATFAPALVLFSALPAIALWFAYRAAASHALERERNRWLVKLGGILAEQVTGEAAMNGAITAIQRIVRAPSMALVPAGSLGVDPLGRAEPGEPLSEPIPRLVHGEDLPPGWRSAVATPMDLGDPAPACLLLGTREEDMADSGAHWTRPWRLPQADGPVLGALVAATATAARAGLSFAALEEESAKLVAVVDHASDGIAMLDDADRVLVWSRTMEQMTGVSATEAASRRGPGASVARRIIEAAAPPTDSGSAWMRSEHLLRADGHELDVLVTTVRVAAAGDGQQVGHVRVVTVHDETRERRLDRLKSDFIATVSHELRTPLTPIKGYAHLLATKGDRMGDARRQQAFSLIADRSDHLSRLVDDLLLASEVSDGAGLPVEMGSFEVGDIVGKVVASFPEAGDRLTVELAQPAALVIADRIRAVQCLANLVSNAHKYTPDGSPIELSVRMGADMVEFHVRDRGQGVPEPERERIFERFYRREDPLTMRTGGAGLGLHIARELAAAMGGSLTLEIPDDAIGSDFVLRLRAAPSDVGGSELVGDKIAAGT